MKSVILISSQKLDVQRMLDAFGRIDSAHLESPGRVVVEGAWGWFAIGTEDDIAPGLDESKRADFAERVPSPNFAQLEYRNSAAIERALAMLPYRGTVLVDDDHGTVSPIDVARRMFATETMPRTEPA